MEHVKFNNQIFTSVYIYSFHTHVRKSFINFYFFVTDTCISTWQFDNKTANRTLQNWAAVLYTGGAQVKLQLGQSYFCSVPPAWCLSWNL